MQCPLLLGFACVSLELVPPPSCTPGAQGFLAYISLLTGGYELYVAQAEACPNPFWRLWPQALGGCCEALVLDCN